MAGKSCLHRELLSSLIFDLQCSLCPQVCAMRRGGLLTILVLVGFGLLLFWQVGFGLLLFWQVLLSGQVFFWHDVSVAYMPLRKLAQEAIRQGHLPLWTMKLGCGFPLLAEGQCATFYPLHISAYLGLPYYYTYSLMVYLHCLMAAVFAALLGRKLNLGWPAAGCCGLVYLSLKCCSSLCWKAAPGCR